MLQSLTAPPVGPPRRVTLACAQCRGRHIRCDGAMPVCSRCRELSMSCEYHKSKRGGKRRKPIAPSAQDIRPKDVTAVHGIPEALTLTQGSVHHILPSPSTSCTAETSSLEEQSFETLTVQTQLRAHLLDLFYANFYASHPCLLPLRRYQQRYSQRPNELQSLDLVIQFIGSLFSPETSSTQFEARVKDSLLQSASCNTGHDIQAMILYATAVYWHDEVIQACRVLNKAIDEALRLGLHLREFASANAEGDSVLEESWRRTWWQLYITDAHISAIDHTLSFRTSQKNVSITAELPCEEAEYLEGAIPPPKKLEEYDNREFTDDDTSFSSYAYLIGILRCFDEYISGHQRETSTQASSMCANADCALKSWLTLLPPSKRNVVSEDGVVDALMFKAMIIVPVYVTDVHRVLSTLKYDKIESVSSCSPPPPPQQMPPKFRQNAPLHTVKILHSFETMIEMLLLPSQMTKHTPFIICMISSATIAHLSACKWVLRGERLRKARERIRVAVGALSSLAEVWPSAKRVLQEVKIIARELLRLRTDQSTNQIDTEPSELQDVSWKDFDLLGSLGGFETWDFSTEAQLFA